MARGFGLALFLALAGCGGAAREKDAAKPRAGACVSDSFEGSAFTRCTAEPGKHTIRTVLSGKDGLPYRDLGRLAADFPASRVAFAMNGGMYDENGQPIGYYVEAGKRLRKLNRVEGGGNFGLLPNGVFSVDEGAWRVRSADAFAEQVKKRPAYATQSGPMLVIDGKLHPRIAENGASLNIRNGVCVDGKGRAHFVISAEAVSFGRLARYMRDKLGCANALYLDGSVSALWDPASARLDRTVPLGPLIVVEKVAKAQSSPAVSTRKPSRVAASTTPPNATESSLR